MNTEEAIKPMEEVERLAGAVKDSMASELNKALGPVYEKLCQMEHELVALRKLVTETGQDLHLLLVGFAIEPGDKYG